MAPFWGPVLWAVARFALPLCVAHFGAAEVFLTSTRPRENPHRTTLLRGFFIRLLALLGIFLCVGPSARAEDVPAGEPDLLATIDQKFGEYFVGPLAKVLFWDLVFWDDTLPMGEIPKAKDGGPLTDKEGRILAGFEGGAYQWRRSGSAPMDSLEIVEPQAYGVAPGVPGRLLFREGSLILEIDGGTPALGLCQSFETCGTQLEAPGSLYTREIQGGTLEIPLPAETTIRVVERSGTVPLVLTNSEAGIKALPGTLKNAPRQWLAFAPGKMVRAAGKEAELTGIEGTEGKLLFSETEATTEALANPAALSIPLVVAWLVFGATFFTFRMGFINLRGFGHALQVTAGKYDHPDHPGEISHFKALSSALSATVGLGNIAGVAIAVQVGGAGAVPWMIIAGFLGMSAKFTECSLGQMYRTMNAQGEVSGGPMHYLYKGLAELGLPNLGKVLAVVFALMCIGGSFGGGNMFQANQAYVSIASEVPWFKDHPGIFGLIIAAFVAAVILGGIKRIANAAGVIVPLMCGIYVLASLWVLAVNVEGLGAAFGEMLRSAFSLEAGFGGLLGALIQGFRRAAFSNEAGIGSASIAHSAASTDEPVREGIVALLEPFIDTVIICTMTGLVVVVTGVHHTSASDGVMLTAAAFETVLPWFPTVLTFTVVLFAFSTQISWSYYGERCATHLLGSWASLPYKVVFVFFAWLGCVLNLHNVVEFSDLMVLGMAFPNILGLLLLSGKVRGKLDDYWGRLQRGEMKPTH